MDNDNANLANFFKANLSLSDEKVKETLKNDVLTQRLKSILEESQKYGSTKEFGTLLYHLASKIKSQHLKYTELLVKYILENKLNNVQRVDTALQYLLANAGAEINTSSLDEYCGVGVVVSTDEIKNVVENHLEKYKETILAERYRFNGGGLMQDVRSSLKWADGKEIKRVVDERLANLLGPKTEEDLKPPPKTKVKAKVQKKAEEGITSPPASTNGEPETNILETMKRLQFHKPGENFTSDGYVITENTSELLKEHLAITGGKVITRFPPEPNGILHIGHAKAININFAYAAAHEGVCILRYDDTNPEKEEAEFFEGIKEMVEWLGYKPYEITHSSDYFDKLFEYAKELIRRGHAYVCHQTAEQMKGLNAPTSPWRDRTVAESAQLFEDMRYGFFDEGEATLRMKITLEEGKQDPVAYRIKYVPHHRTGDKWCVYPTYDFTHCLCDSIENITHSFCTKEFQSRRSSYYWLCNVLDLYCPVQWEYGRLNVNYTVVSKRKILKLINEDIVTGWDDPRLFTLTALRRKGYPPEAINRFCAKMGVTGAQAVVDPQMIESEVRSVLNEQSPRTMAILRPLRVNIVNRDALNAPRKIQVPDFPNDPERGTHFIRFSDVVYIEKDDFYEVAPDKGYRRFTKDQPVGLRYAGVVLKFKDIIREGEEIKCVLAEGEIAVANNKPKAFVHWVAEPRNAEFRLYESLFTHKNPDEAKDGYISDVNPNSLTVLNGFVDEYLRDNYDACGSYQFERVGFFCVDSDSKKDNLVFNRTVTLKEDSGKN